MSSVLSRLFGPAPKPPETFDVAIRLAGVARKHGFRGVSVFSSRVPGSPSRYVRFHCDGVARVIRISDHALHNSHADFDLTDIADLKPALDWMIALKFGAVG